MIGAGATFFRNHTVPSTTLGMKTPLKKFSLEELDLVSTIPASGAIHLGLGHSSKDFTGW